MTCPMCDEHPTDQSPCLCGYKMCSTCYTRILSSDNPSCPACRCEYDATATNKYKSKLKATVTHHSQLSYEELSNIRVRQKNLVYVVGLPINLCDEQTLKTNKWFGCFGKIKKVYCNKKTSHASRTGSFAAFITFYRENDAMKAIQIMNGKYLDDGHRMLKATTGSTKYCSYFLRGSSCSNPQCLYLHEWANKEDVVTKEELNDFGPITTTNTTAISISIKINNDNEIDEDQDSVATNRTVLSSKKTKIAKISKFDYTRVVKKGIMNEHPPVESHPEYPPLDAPPKNIKNATKTPPIRPAQKIRTKPPIGHPQNIQNRKKTLSIANNNHMMTSKSEKLISIKSNHNTHIPKISLDDTSTSTNTNKIRIQTQIHTQTQSPTKSVIFDDMVDIVGDEDEYEYEEEKIEIIHIPLKKRTIKHKEKKGNKERISHRAAAEILLNELMQSKQMNDTASVSTYGHFKLSDLLKDGMLSIEELKMIEMDKYNYYYFLQSDKVIFQQFHKQFINHFNNTAKLQKSKA